MSFLNVWVCAFRRRKASCGLWVSAYTCFYSGVLTLANLNMSVYVCVYACVKGSGELGLLASWPHLASRPLPQSTSPCLLHRTDPGYCPAQSTLESSTSPGISILITTHTTTHTCTRCGVVRVWSLSTKREYISTEVIKKESPWQWAQKTANFHQNWIIMFFSVNKLFVL